MIAFLERFSRKAKAEGVWNGILVGDISQPRGGPMLTGHASHQVGLDADVWLTPMPDHRLSREERETMSAVDMVNSRWALGRQVALDAGADGDHQGCGRGARGRAHLRQRRDQEGPVRDREGPAVDAKGARLLGAQLPFPHPHQMSGGRLCLRTAGACASGRRLRQIAQLVVHRGSAASAPRAAEAAAAHGCVAARMPNSCSGEVAVRRPRCRCRRVGVVAEPVGEPPETASKRRRSGECRRANKDRDRVHASMFMKPSSSLIPEMATIEAINLSFSSLKSISAIQCGRPSFFPDGDWRNEIGVAGEKDDHDRGGGQRQIDDPQVRTEGPASSLSVRSCVSNS